MTMEGLCARFIGSTPHEIHFEPREMSHPPLSSYKYLHQIAIKISVKNSKDIQVRVARILP